MSRFEVETTGEEDRLGNPGYAVRDTAHDRIEETFDGYFAANDAKALAADLNDEEDAMAKEEES